MHLQPTGPAVYPIQVLSVSSKITQLPDPCPHSHIQGAPQTARHPTVTAPHPQEVSQLLGTTPASCHSHSQSVRKPLLPCLHTNPDPTTSSHSHHPGVSHRWPSHCCGLEVPLLSSVCSQLSGSASFFKVGVR